LEDTHPQDRGNSWPHCEFNFIADPKLRAALQQDYHVARSMFDAACYPYAVVRAGHGIETILLERLSANRAGALSSREAPKAKLDIGQWDLAELAAVASTLGPDFGNVAALPNTVIHWRDLARPGTAWDLPHTKIGRWEEEARVALQILLDIDRRLSTHGGVAHP